MANDLHTRGLIPEFVLGQLTPAVKSAAITFWNSEGALTGDAATARAEQLLAVVRDGDGNLVAVATGAVVPQAPLVLQPLFSFRTFVAAKRRQQGIASDLLAFTFDALDRHVRAEAEPGAIGVFIRYPAALATLFDQHLTWPHLQFSFIGKTPDGNHLRVRYFEEIKLK
jgi:GNAT superfamily N-acetyltransferase